LEPIILSEKIEVNGFGSEDFTLLFVPIKWERYDAIDAFRIEERDWTNPEASEECSDRRYLLETYGFKTDVELIESLGVKVIGNIHQDSHLMLDN